MSDRAILIVDDDSGVINSLKRILRGRPYQAFFSMSGSQAIETIKFHAIHVVITDMMMPDMDGLTLLKHVEKIDPKIIRMMLSSKSDTKSILQAVNNGNIYRYILKPWDNIDILIQIKQALEYFDLQEEKRNLVKELENHKKLLEQKVEKRTSQLLAVESTAEMGKHTSQIVHNLNNSLNGIIGSLDLMKSFLDEKDPDIADIKDLCDNARIASDILAETISEILIRSRNKGKFQSEFIDINQIVKQELLFFDMNSEFKYKISKKMNLCPDLPMIHGSPIQLRQVIDNLIKNAIDAMDNSKEKKLEITTNVKGESVMIIVSDTGEGIGENELPLIFSADFTTKPVGKGTGLGLASVKTMVEAHKGEIKVKSKKGRGSSFIIELPAEGRNGDKLRDMV